MITDVHAETPSNDDVSLNFQFSEIPTWKEYWLEHMTLFWFKKKKREKRKVGIIMNTLFST